MGLLGVLGNRVVICVGPFLENVLFSVVCFVVILFREKKLWKIDKDISLQKDCCFFTLNEGKKVPRTALLPPPKTQKNTKSPGLLFVRKLKKLRSFIL